MGHLDFRLNPYLPSGSSRAPVFALSFAQENDPADTTAGTLPLYSPAHTYRFPGRARRPFDMLPKGGVGQGDGSPLKDPRGKVIPA